MGLIVRAVHVRRVRSEDRSERYRRVSVDKTSRFTNARRHTSTQGRGEVQDVRATEGVRRGRGARGVRNSDRL